MEADAILYVAEQMPRLATLSLRQSFLTDGALSALPRCTALTSLDLADVVTMRNALRPHTLPPGNLMDEEVLALAGAMAGLSVLDLSRQALASPAALALAARLPGGFHAQSVRRVLH